MKLYLCGPINGCTDTEARDWREMVKSLWPGETIDPMRRDYRGREDQNTDAIVELDKIDIMRSDAVIVSYDKPSVGTSMEVIFAFERGKPIVVVAAQGTRISPWLRYHSHHITSSYALAVNTLKDMVQ
jgi:nucleoside 2-deoxyribosyltransferase